MAANAALEAFDTALAQISKLVATADNDARSFMSTKLTQLARQIEPQNATLYRIGHSVGQYINHDLSMTKSYY